MILLFFLFNNNIWLIIKACGGGHLSASALNDLGLGTIIITIIIFIIIIILKHDHLFWIMYIYYIWIIVIVFITEYFYCFLIAFYY